jgi:hypothetical protein
VNTQKSPGRHTALEELAQFALDEAGYRPVALALPGQEGFQVPGDRFVEYAFLRPAREIILGRLADGTATPGFEHSGRTTHRPPLPAVTLADLPAMYLMRLGAL